ncbi:MAG: PEP-CTERM sorting domain-containing protein [Tepidisphaeraceae bacterium]
MSDNSYPGIDAVSLTGIVVPEPASLTLVGFSSIGMLTVRIRKQVSTSAA